MKISNYKDIGNILNTKTLKKTSFEMMKIYISPTKVLLRRILRNPYNKLFTNVYGSSKPLRFILKILTLM